jgi:hypothetical protein
MVASTSYIEYTIPIGGRENPDTEKLGGNHQLSALVNWQTHTLWYKNEVRIHANSRELMI